MSLKEDNKKLKKLSHTRDKALLKIEKEAEKKILEQSIILKKRWN